MPDHALDPVKGRRKLLLNPELVHPQEGSRILALEDMPKAEVGHRTVAGEPDPVLQLGATAELETEKRQIVLCEKSADVRQREAMLLNMKHQIATAADGEEISASDVLQRRSIRKAHHLLTASANLRRGRAKAPLRNESARRHDV